MENFEKDTLIDKENSQFDQIEIERAQEEKLSWLQKEKLEEIKKELEYCEGDLGNLGWDPRDPDVIPADLDGDRKQRYNYLINQREGLLSRKNALLNNKESQEN